MTLYTLTATVRQAALKVVPGKGEAGKLISLGARTVELPAAASASTIDFGNIPTNFRISGNSRIYWDDLATSGSPLLDLGLLAVNANVTSSTNCLNDSLDISAVSTANVGKQVIKDIADFGKPAWQINGAASDPGGHLKISGKTRAAATTQTGTITLDLYGYLD